MKKPILFVLALSFAALLIQSTPKSNYIERSQRFDHFVAAIERLKDCQDANELTALFTTSKKAFKSLESEWSYLSDESVQQWINGAPLPKIIEGIPGNEIREPQGLQRLEELVHEPIPDLKEVQRITKMLHIHALEDARFYGDYQMSSAQTLRAAQLQIIRCMSLGITGFDTPASDQGIVYSSIAMDHTSRALQTIEFVPNSLQGSWNTLLSKWQNCTNYLSTHSDFNTFSRTLFIKEHLVPLYRDHVQFRKAFEEFFPVKKQGPTQPFVWDEEFLFSSALINTYAFSKLSEKDATQELVALGEQLFNEPLLSRSKNMSCASCHQKELAFQDGKKTSFGFRSEQTIQRNTPTLINTAQSPSYLWDNSVEILEHQFIHVFRSKEEFDISFVEMEKQLLNDPDYAKKFEALFPKSRTSFRSRLESALAAYLHSLTQYNSRFDQYMQGTASLSAQEQRGFDLFMGKAACATCHFAPTFSGLVPPLFKEMEGEVLGVLTAPLSSEIDPDDGKYGSSTVNSEEFHKFMFKTVTVRNIEHTAPYMHNGAYPTLESVLEFYNHGGAAGLELSLDHQTLPPDSLHLSSEEQAAIIAFMKTLNSEG